MATTLQKKGSLISKMGRPQQSLLGSFDQVVIDKIIAYRLEHRGWGPKTIYVEMMSDKSVNHLKIPKPSTIALLLKHKNLVKNYNKHISLPGSELHPASYPHQIWQVDGQGATEIAGLGRVKFINIKDVYSKVYCGSLPYPSSSHQGSANTTEYQHSLRLAFTEFGLPNKIQTDHAAVFYENKGASPFPTAFHLWLIGLGIELIFSRKYRPTDQAIVERSHQTIERQVRRESGFTSIESLIEYTNERRGKLNKEIPSQSCNGQPPLHANPAAKHSRKFYNVQLEAHLIELDRIYQYLAKGRWIRKGTSASGKSITLGGHQYYLPQLTPKSKVEITFDQQTCQLRFRDLATKIELQPKPIIGITKQKLLGADRLNRFCHGYQFQIPF